MSDKLLEVKDLNVIYQTDLETVHAVNGISFSIDHRETLGLVGETGAGKTTTALTILRLLSERTGRITGGEVLFEGEDILRMDTHALRELRGSKISMTALNPILTIKDQIEEAIHFHNTAGMDKGEISRHAEEVLEMVGISAARKNDYPHQLSGGMKQRVVIAMALACQPLLLLADEPTTALDVTIQAQVLTLMNELKEKLGTAVLMITHDLGIVAETCDSVAVMYAGEIVEYGTTKQVFTGEVHHPYTEGLFGAIPSLEEEPDRLHPIDGLMPDPTDLPQGCAFSPRCPYCTDLCREQKPRDQVRDGHRVRCHRYQGYGEVSE